MTEERKNLISRKELCAITGVSYNELVQQFRNRLTIAPVCAGKENREQLYDRDYAIQWVNNWRSGAHRKRLQAHSPKLMFLNVKPKKHKKTVQSLDNLKKPSYHQEIRK
jgi:phage terminase Nu1 subunit (DNA packaging protein)